MAVRKCPSCQNFMNYVKTERYKEGAGGFSVGKAAVGAVIAGPIGLVAGALGKKGKDKAVETYVCPKCGFSTYFEVL